MFRVLRIISCTATMLLLPSFLVAQGSQTGFGNVNHDSSLPVEVSSDNLDFNQDGGTATFTGNVLIGQGEMRLTAPRVHVIYHKDDDTIERLQATGGVTLVNGSDAAEAARADYNLDTGMIVMRGDVLLLQGDDALTADTVFVDTEAGTARMNGRVKTILQSEN